MDDRLKILLEEAKERALSITTIELLEQCRVEYLGKKGKITAISQELGALPKEERPAFGQAVNEVKQHFINLIEEKEASLRAVEVQNQLKNEALDVTLPGRGQSQGSLHPLTQVRLRVETLFKQLGFAIADGPEIETEDYNFTLLNIPKEHPARAMQDTFYFDNGALLRTHTSPVQIRYLQTHPLPVRVIATGRVYRCDSDVTHTPMFHQMEGLVVDEGINFSHLKGMLEQFLRCFFEQEIAVRFRPSYFPFTEPSAEVDMQCVNCLGAGCRICSDTGWLEILGCGMVHPHVLQAVNIDSERYTGFAFGVGLDRLAMLYYNIPDLRMMFENDERFLKQF